MSIWFTLFKKLSQTKIKIRCVNDIKKIWILWVSKLKYTCSVIKVLYTQIYLITAKLLKNETV